MKPVCHIFQTPDFPDNVCGMQEQPLPLLVNGKHPFSEQPGEKTRKGKAPAVGHPDLVFPDCNLCFYIPRTEKVLFREGGSFPVKAAAGILFPEIVVGRCCDLAGRSHKDSPVVIAESQIENGRQDREKNGHDQGSFNSEASPEKEKRNCIPRWKF
jgi:hypothetical protein